MINYQGCKKIFLNKGNPLNQILHQERHFATLVLLSAENVENRGSDCAERFPHGNPQLHRQSGGQDEKSTPNQLEILWLKQTFSPTQKAKLEKARQKAKLRKKHQDAKLGKAPQKARRKSWFWWTEYYSPFAFSFRLHLCLIRKKEKDFFSKIWWKRSPDNAASKVYLKRYMLQ